MRVQGLCRWLGEATNNEAEYYAVIDGLKAAAEWRPDRLEVYLDSKLVVEQLKGTYRVKEPRLKALHRTAKELLDRFGDYEVKHVDREHNKGADALANRAIDANVKKPRTPG